MKYIYGPIKSRRLGYSLGISLFSDKTCNFDCIYCQLGPTKNKINQRKEYVARDVIIAELRGWFSRCPKESAQLDFVTFSGAGEPTLYQGIGDIISEIKRMTAVPIALLTNSSLLGDSLVRREILGLDLIVPSLDAVTQAIFAKIDRPYPGLSIETIINGLVGLRKEFRGKIWLEIMLVKGVNDSWQHIEAMRKVIYQIKPDKIQLNSPVRPPAEPGVSSLDKETLLKIKGFFGPNCELL